MKKLLCALLVCLLLPVMALADGVVNVYNWCDYINEDVLDIFTAETGIEVNYIYFDDNEKMMVQMEADSSQFDVIFPSEYCVQRMIDLNMIQELDYSKIPNFVHIREDLLNPSYDPNNAHSVPYMWGTLGILYNTELVDEADVHTWSVLWSEKYRGQIMMMDSLRDAMGVALKYQGHSVNSNDYMELRAATDLLVAQKPFVKAYGLDEFKDKMVANEAALALVYSGDAQYSVELNDKLDYAIPEEGSNVWVDCAVISDKAQNVENAYAFINFLCRPDIAIMNCEEIGYCSPNATAIEEMGEEYADNYIMNPSPEIINRCEYYNKLDDAWLTIYTTLWQEVKNAK